VRKVKGPSGSSAAAYHVNRADSVIITVHTCCLTMP
jgi:hypothetical protein